MAAAWCLNLWAEHELAAPGRTPPRRVLDASARFAVRAETLMAPGDVRVEALEQAASDVTAGAHRPPARDRVGRAWCVTPTAVARLRAAGVRLPAMPSFEAVRAVNDRALQRSLPGGHADGELVTDEARLRGKLAAGGRWRAKPRFGMAGRGQRTLDAGRLDAADERWLLPRVTTTGVWLERELDVRAEYALHLCFGPGHARVARVCRQRCDAHGQWRSSAAVDEVPGLHPRDRDAAVRAVFDAAERADYFGPIGVDVLVYDDGSGRSSVYVGSDVQGRFTMGWNGGEPVCASCACGL